MNNLEDVKDALPVEGELNADKPVKVKAGSDSNIKIDVERKPDGTHHVHIKIPANDTSIEPPVTDALGDFIKTNGSQPHHAENLAVALPEVESPVSVDKPRIQAPKIQPPTSGPGSDPKNPSRPDALVEHVASAERVEAKVPSRGAAV